MTKYKFGIDEIVVVKSTEELMRLIDKKLEGCVINFSMAHNYAERHLKVVMLDSTLGGEPAYLLTDPACSGSASYYWNEWAIISNIKEKLELLDEA